MSNTKINASAKGITEVTTAAKMPLSVPLIYPPSRASQLVLTEVKQLIAVNRLPIELDAQTTSAKLTQKYREQLSQYVQAPILLIDEKGQLNLLIDGISVAPDWAKLQRRIVSAGRKTELLLQATKLTAAQCALDATAGFGHDSLILASTGAQVTMLEREPLLALLLLAEQRMMSKEPNWQKLMSRLTIKNIASEEYLAMVNKTTAALLNEKSHLADDVTARQFDVIYLDPMFPEDSYTDRKTGKGAKVGKHMQALHGLVAPPNEAAELALFLLAQQLLEHRSEGSSKRLVIKRPINAPTLAQQIPNEYWQNDVVRFDGYLF